MNTPYCKTEAGKREIGDRKQKLPPALRSLLLMVDGQRDVTQLLDLIVRLRAPENSLGQLLAMGLITQGEVKESRPPEIAPLGPLVSDPSPAEAVSVVDAGKYRQLYDVASEAVRRHLGIKGYFIQLKIEKCANLDDLLALLPEIATALTKAKDHTFATEWLVNTRAVVGKA